MRIATHTVAAPSFDAVKMEDRKRPIIPDHDDVAPPAKRQALVVNGAKSAVDADLANDSEIVAFQKDAIIRQMKEFKRQKVSLEATVEEMKKRTQYHDDHLRIIDTWFDQVLDEIKVLADDELVFELPPQPDEALFPTSLLFSDVERFQEHLASRSTKIKSALTDLFTKIPRASPDVVRLQAQVSHLLTSEKEHIAEQHRINAEMEQLSERLEAASYRYMLAERKLDRAKSAAVAKLEQQAIQTSTSGGDESSGAAADSANATNGTLNAKAAAEAETAKQEALAETSVRKDQIDKLSAENKKLTEQLTALTIKNTGFTDEDYSKTELFKAIKSQHEDAIKRLNNLEAINIQLREDAKKFQAERTQYRTEIDEESRIAITDSESNLAKAETDLARIRNARDEILSELGIKKAEYDRSWASTDQIKELASASESRIAALEAEVERLRMKLKEVEVSPEEGSNLDDLSADELRAKIRALEREYSLLSNELPSMETAWRKSQALAKKKIEELAAWEEQVQRTNAERAKFEQKFFAAMKAKEAREAEYRALKNQNNKSSEIIKQLKDAETDRRNATVNMDKQLAESKDLIANVSLQHRSLQNKITEANLGSEAASKQIAELQEALAEKDAAHLAAKQAQREAEAEAKKLEIRLADTKKSLETWEKKGLGNQSDIERQLRHMAYCTVCRANEKNTVIKVCGHAFCEQCVQDRLSNRMRKCPACSRAFGTNDYMRIHLNY